MKNPLKTDESELKYLEIIRNIRDKDVDLFRRLNICQRKLVHQKNSSPLGEDKNEGLFNYLFPQGKLHKFFRTSSPYQGEGLR